MVLKRSYLLKILITPQLTKNPIKFYHFLPEKVSMLNSQNSNKKNSWKNWKLTNFNGKSSKLTLDNILQKISTIKANLNKLKSDKCLYTIKKRAAKAKKAKKTAVHSVWNPKLWIKFKRQSWEWHWLNSEKIRKTS